MRSALLNEGAGKWGLHASKLHRFRRTALAPATSVGGFFWLYDAIASASQSSFRVNRNRPLQANRGLRRWRRMWPTRQ
jgi:hypothetical protein